jgi:hypothetical protein
MLGKKVLGEAWNNNILTLSIPLGDATINNLNKENLDKLLGGDYCFDENLNLVNKKNIGV